MFLIFLCSCNAKKVSEVKTIDLSPELVSPTNKIDIESIIKLETTEESLIGEITKIKYYNKKFYVFDQNESQSLFVFNSDGKFINKINRGQGPGEIIEPWDFNINEDNGSILLWDQMTFNLNKYDELLNYQETIGAQGIAIRSFSELDDESHLLFSQFFPVDNGEIIQGPMFDYLIYNKDFTKVIKKLNKTDPRTATITSFNPICKFNSEHFLIVPMDNNIYTLSDNNQLIPAYRLNLGKFEVTSEDLDKGTKYYRSEMSKGNRICSLCNLFVNDSYITISYSYKDETQYCIYDRDGNLKLNSVLNQNPKQLPHCQIKELTANDTFIGTVTPLDLIGFYESNNIQTKEEIKPFDNQYLVLFKVK